MAKAIPDARLDAMLAVLEGSELHYCSAQPTTYTEANVTYNLATAAITGSNYAAAAGDTNGRKATITPPTDTTIDTTGTATHICITSGGTTIEIVTTCTSQALTAANTVTGAAFDHELADPT